LPFATACIQPGIRPGATNAEDRNVNGSNSSVLRPMMVSRWRTSMPAVFDRALNTTPSSADDTTSSTTPESG
jgi:hypothetical protein